MTISETGRRTQTRVWLTAHYRSVSWWFCRFTSGCREWGRPRTILNKWFTGKPLLFVTISIYYCYYDYFPAHRHADRDQRWCLGKPFPVETDFISRFPGGHHSILVQDKHKQHRHSDLPWGCTADSCAVIVEKKNSNQSVAYLWTGELPVPSQSLNKYVPHCQQ